MHGTNGACTHAQTRTPSHRAQSSTPSARKRACGRVPGRNPRRQTLRVPAGRVRTACDRREGSPPQPVCAAECRARPHLGWPMERHQSHARLTCSLSSPIVCPPCACVQASWLHCARHDRTQFVTNKVKFVLETASWAAGGRGWEKGSTGGSDMRKGNTWTKKVCRLTTYVTSVAILFGGIALFIIGVYFVAVFTREVRHLSRAPWQPVCGCV